MYLINQSKKKEEAERIVIERRNKIALYGKKRELIKFYKPYKNYPIQTTILGIKTYTKCDSQSKKKK